MCGRGQGPGAVFLPAYELEDELSEPERPTITYPDRIRQGIEFNYCCVQAVRTFRELVISPSW